MIYTVTFNPAIDYILNVPCLLQGEINRALSEEYFIGGKGINVSLVLHQLTVESTALGFVAGFTGDKVLEELKKSGIRADFVKLCSGNTRINVKLRCDHETDINAVGPDINTADLKEFLNKLDRLESGDFLVLAGSVPKSLPQNVYETVMQKICPKGVKVVIDAEGSLLTSTLKYKPFLIKPNHHELSAICGTPVNTVEDAFCCAQKLKDQGAGNVMVSMAEKGAVLLCENGERYFTNAPEGQLINSVGAGDSAVAGFIAGTIANMPYYDTLRLAVACGSATAFSKGLANRQKIDDVLQNFKDNNRR